MKSYPLIHQLSIHQNIYIMKIKTLLTNLILLIGFCTTLTHAQSNAKQLGKITYLEGTVQLINNGVASPASINSLLYPNQTIKTGTKSTAEILWSNGTKTNVEANSSYNVTDLYNQSSGQALAQSESVFSGFKKVFRAAKESKLAEEGGIRRAKAKADTMTPANQVYWKEDKEMTFDEASAYYEKGDYVKAAWAFKTFLDQKPLNEMAKYATFALGHSYLKLNNQVKAREVFESFINKYSNDELRTQAESVLAKFPQAN